ncbi:MFS transporter [Gordonia sp. SID5947]|uniref:MFS transporter n=1 Tax=Gordonia sp. SID5947 TaxID=2690315 RepID=UPI001369DCE0|nr:MFS transporter [Gordonia sp. SID5947]MYR08921.1 MFS transporter [Gordonia sp. SID5947]
MFADPTVPGAGLSAAAISSLFILWSACSFLFEIPAGILADRIPRRLLVVTGPVCSGAGFALWTWWPSYGSFAAGFVLWAVGTALRSGALQALLYDTLAARGQAMQYAALAGRVRAMGATGVLVGTATAIPLTAWGGYPAAGAASVIACLFCAAASAMLPEDAPPRRVGNREDAAHRDRDGGTRPDSDAAGWRGVVAEAFAHLRGDRLLRRVVVLAIALTWVSALDEYLPLLADTMWSGTAWWGSAATGVSMLMVVVAVGDIAGGHAASRTDVTDLRPRRLVPWLLAGAAALGLGAISGHPAGIILVAFAFGVFSWSLVMADAIMQRRLPSGARATITSVVGVGEEMVAIGAFGAWAVGSTWLAPTTSFAVAAVPYAVMALVLMVSSSGATTARASGR